MTIPQARNYQAAVGLSRRRRRLLRTVSKAWFDYRWISFLLILSSRESRSETAIGYPCVYALAADDNNSDNDRGQFRDRDCSRGQYEQETYPIGSRTTPWIQCVVISGAYG